MIYLIKIKNTNYIKIGYTIRPKERLSQYYTHLPKELIEYFIVNEGSEEDESEWQFQLNEYRTSCEWFDIPKDRIFKIENHFKKYEIIIEPKEKTKRPSKALENIIKEIRKEWELNNKSLHPKFDYACEKFPFLEDAINKLGLSKIGTLKCVPKRIKEELLIMDDNSTDIKIIKLLNFKPGEFISPGEAKKQIQKAYESLHIKHVTKSEEIKKFYDVEYKSKRIDDKVIKGYIIIRNKINIK